MLTFTQMKQQAADNTGLYTDSPEMGKVVRDISTGVKRFQNAARRYWTQREKKTNLIKDQMYYQFSSDMLRVSNVSAIYGGRYTPITLVRSEQEWNRLNSAPGFGSNTPSHYFIKGANEIGIYPVPSGNVTDGLLVSFEPRMVDMAIDDICIGAVVESGSSTVQLEWGDEIEKNISNNCYLTVGEGLDGYWYKIIGIEGDLISLDNVYQGQSSEEAKVTIGQCPPFPEEYHDAPVYYACHQFFLLRKDLESASMYKQLFDAAFAEYKQVYGNKSTGGLINPSSGSAALPSNIAWPGVLRS